VRRSEREIKRISELEDIIRKADVCRIAIANNDMPYIVTMNFGYEGGDQSCLYFHCAVNGKKIEMLKQNNLVCFEMDINHELYKGKKGCDWGMRYRSVLGYGHISFVNDKELKKRGLDCIMAHYGGEAYHEYNESVFERTTIMRLDIKEITGKKC
jgi:nitroimidazol reductase NimA-like FMN-containing flavoprotein (pyridoxamine 5'-phosphate oxidase superfamily)